MVFCFEDTRWYFNQGKLLTRKTSNETEHLMEFPIIRWFKFTLKPPYSIMRDKL